MKKLANRLIQSEKGQALMLTLILLGVGGLMLPPLMGLMSTGLIVGQAFEDEMKEFYAADAGIEYGLWRIINNEGLPTPGGNQTYDIAVNDRSVSVIIWYVDVDPTTFRIRSTAGGATIESYVGW